MRIYKMQATFGKLENQILELQPGLNIIEAPNVHDAIRTRASRPYVIRHGKVIASFERKATLL